MDRLFLLDICIAAYKRVVMMNPWQQIKLTLRTLGSLLRGQALAPSNYGSVPSAVGRTDGDFLAEEAAQAVRRASEPAESAVLTDAGPSDGHSGDRPSGLLSRDAGS